MISTELLRRFGFLAGVGEDNLRRIAMISEQQSVDTEAQVFNEGDPADYFYLVISGEVDVRIALGSGDRRIVDTIVGGELLGWSALLAEPNVYVFDGVARTPVELIAIDSKLLRGLMETEHDLGYRLMAAVTATMAHRLRNARVQLARTELV